MASGRLSATAGNFSVRQGGCKDMYVANGSL